MYSAFKRAGLWPHAVALLAFDIVLLAMIGLPWLAWGALIDLGQTLVAASSIGLGCGLACLLAFIVEDTP